MWQLAPRSAACLGEFGKMSGIDCRRFLRSPPSPPTAPYFSHSLPVSLPSRKFLETPVTQAKFIWGKSITDECFEFIFSYFQDKLCCWVNSISYCDDKSHGRFHSFSPLVKFGQTFPNGIQKLFYFTLQYQYTHIPIYLYNFVNKPRYSLQSHLPDVLFKRLLQDTMVRRWQSDAWEQVWHDALK